MEIEEYLKQLKTCQTEQEFKEMWDSDKIYWWWESISLCIHFNKYFYIWWNPDNFNWVLYSDYLCLYCHEYFNTWWDYNKFNWSYITYLQTYCNKYKHIWKKDYIKYKLKGD